MDLSKSFDLLPYKLILAKLYADGVAMKNLELLQDYPSSRIQRTKVDSNTQFWSQHGDLKYHRYFTQVALFELWTLNHAISLKEYMQGDNVFIFFIHI